MIYTPQESSQPRPSLLIVGVDSQIGSALYNKLTAESQYNVFGTSRRSHKQPSNQNIFFLDLSKNPRTLQTKQKFDYVVFCAGITSMAFCESEPELSRKINVESTAALIHRFNNEGSYVLFLSSNAVFDGSKPFYSIQDLPNPTTNYGKFKKEVEDQLKEKSNVAILRLTKVIADSTPFINRWEEKLSKGLGIKVFSNRLLSAAPINAVLNSICLLLERKATGLYHFGGSDEISYSEFAQKYFATNPTALSLLSIENESGENHKITHNSLTTYLPTFEAQYDDLLSTPRQTMGLMSGHAYIEDPKRLAFTLSRYKFVAKMFSGKNNVLEVGCADGFGTPIVLQEVKQITAVDFDWTFISDAKINHPYRDRIVFKQHDITTMPVGSLFDAVFCLDVFEHIKSDCEVDFLSNICDSLADDGILIIGIPSLESQQYASPISKAGHVNCKTGPDLKNFLSRFFANVFVFSMNDEVVHTGYSPMAHYLLALCCQKKLHVTRHGMT